MKQRRFCRLLFLVAVSVTAWRPVFASESPAAVAEKWQRQVLTLGRHSGSDRPFAEIVDVDFTHTASDRVITVPAYYAGDDVWRVGFLPQRTGTWRYRVRSELPSLNAVSGQLDVRDTGRPGKLIPDSDDPRKWRLADGPPILPIALRMEFALLPEHGGPHACDGGCWEKTVTFLREEINAHFLDTRLQDEYDTDMNVFDGPPDAMTFDLEFWDRLERRLALLSDAGGGAYIMFYADDAGKPQWPGRSAIETLLIRYAVARLSGFPRIIWDVGIDISEYRSRGDVAWFGNTLAALDPFDHPLSSRVGGGSGMYFMPARTYESLGDRRARMPDMLYYFARARRPILMSDSFAENRPDTPAKSFTPQDVRRALWKGVMAGGLGIFLRGSDGYFYPDTLESDLESEQWIRHVNTFVTTRLGSRFLGMTPCHQSVMNGYCLANAAGDTILVWTPGKTDADDPTTDVRTVLSLATHWPTAYRARLYDPRTARETAAAPRQQGRRIEIAWPDGNDWLLILERSEGTLSEPR